LVDGQDISSCDLLSYYQHIGYLTQEPSVFDGTILENLLYASSSHPTQEKIQEAIDMAHCDFIYDFKDGLDTQIGERWIRLSGWQRQRLAIAKIFLKNPHVIFLDEPTSALDSISEQAINDSLEKLFVWRTVIVIAHRLQTVQSADEIIVLSHGSIVERGNHNDLSIAGGAYQEMLTLQRV
jgi:ABC-type multidrug transport system fused ATPase/permease subunit